MGGSLVQPEGELRSPQTPTSACYISHPSNPSAEPLSSVCRGGACLGLSSAAFAAKGFFLFFFFNSSLQKLVYDRQGLTDSWHPSHPRQTMR